MPKSYRSDFANGHFNTIVGAIRAKKGQLIVALDLSSIEASMATNFIIAHAESTVQTRAIAEAIEKQMIEINHQKPFHREGYENSFWILLDYGDIIVHVFQKPYREFYNLEELWADGHLTRLGD